MSVIEQIEAAGWTVFESVTPEPKQWNVGYHDGPGEQNVPRGRTGRLPRREDPAGWRSASRGSARPGYAGTPLRRLSRWRPGTRSRDARPCPGSRPEERQAPRDEALPSEESRKAVATASPDSLVQPASPAGDPSPTEDAQVPSQGARSGLPRRSVASRRHAGLEAWADTSGDVEDRVGREAPTDAAGAAERARAGASRRALGAVESDPAFRAMREERRRRRSAM